MTTSSISPKRPRSPHTARFAGSTGSALRGVRPTNLHNTLGVGAISPTAQARPDSSVALAHSRHGLCRSQGASVLFSPPAPFTSCKPFPCTIVRHGARIHGDIGRANESPAGTQAPRTSEIHDWRERGRSPREASEVALGREVDGVGRDRQHTYTMSKLRRPFDPTAAKVAISIPAGAEDRQLTKRQAAELGGKKRAESLSQQRRSEIASRAAKARWKHYSR